ncbi:uncharacterized protein ALTATR162_LOCUS9372 [Alternaria atra]|uniref:Uncharacterized protein n=1 Tax=Alternaria atra TaxID=119953 RepID=A0A8J2I9A5_9PLEO|nr:uncharacterized protein ALTATR162_LOCUS9372 [Alternaria atra]CAG5179610.1 unnamed protein product [Alternaria atra]
METLDADSRESIDLPSINHMDAGRVKRKEVEYQRKHSAAMPNPLHLYASPPHLHSNRQFSVASAVPGSLGGLLSPPESRRTSSDEKKSQRPTARHYGASALIYMVSSSALSLFIRCYFTDRTTGTVLSIRSSTYQSRIFQSFITPTKFNPQRASIESKPTVTTSSDPSGFFASSTLLGTTAAVFDPSTQPEATSPSSTQDYAIPVNERRSH